MVDSRLIGNVVATVERRAAAPVTPLVSVKPQAHTSSYLMLEWHLHYGSHLSVRGDIDRNAQLLGLGAWATWFTDGALARARTRIQHSFCPGSVAKASHTAGKWRIISNRTSVDPSRAGSTALPIEKRARLSATSETAGRFSMMLVSLSLQVCGREPLAGPVRLPR